MGGQAVPKVGTGWSEAETGGKKNVGEQENKSKTEKREGGRKGKGGRKRGRRSDFRRKTSEEIISRTRWLHRIRDERSMFFQRGKRKDRKGKSSGSVCQDGPTGLAVEWMAPRGGSSGVKWKETPTGRGTAESLEPCYTVDVVVSVYRRLFPPSGPLNGFNA